MLTIMNKIKTAHLFPVFVSEYIGNEKKIISEYSNDFDSLLTSASKIVDCDLSDFNIQTNNFLSDELKSQYIAYIFSCAVSNILKQKNIVPDYVAGYSMGLYGALYHCRSISFDDGLKLIQNAYNIISNSINNEKFGMGIVAGLEYQDIDKIICQNSIDVEIVNTNSSNSYVISGIYSEIDKILFLAKQEGAIHTRLLPVSIPYHSKFLCDAAKKFNNYLKKVHIKPSLYALVSSIDQRIIKTKEDVEKELVRNINSKIYWLNTMLKMINLDVKVFIECGAGKGLYKIGKFIPGDFKIYSINKLGRFIDSFNVI